MPNVQGSFLCPTSTGNHSVTGIGFKPHLVIFFGGAKADPQGGGSGADMNLWFGVANRALEQWVSTINCINGAATTDATSAFSATSCILTHTTASAKLFEAAIVSMDDDGFTVNFTTAPGTARRIFYIAYELKDSSIKIGTFTNAASTGNQSFTGVGFQPKLLIASTGVTDGTSCCFSLGAALSTSSRWAHAVNIRDNSGSNLGGAYCTRTSRFIEYLRITGPREAIVADLVSFNADGFTLNYSTAILAKQFGYIAIAGDDVDVDVGAFDKGALSSSYTVTGMAFQPQGLFMTINPLGSMNAGFVGNLSQCIGACDSDLNQGSESALAGASTKNSNNFTSITDIANDSSGSLATAQGAITDLTADGFIITYDSLGLNIGHGWFVINGEPESSGPNFIKIKNNVEVPAKATHYMTIRHDTADLTRADWTIQLFKNGEEIRDIAVDVIENSERTYTFSFQNDGTHDSQWSLLVYETALDTPTYMEMWIVKKKIVEQTVRQIQARQDSDGGFFQTSQGGG